MLVNKFSFLFIYIFYFTAKIHILKIKQKFKNQIDNKILNKNSKNLHK